MQRKLHVQGSPDGGVVAEEIRGEAGLWEETVSF